MKYWVFLLVSVSLILFSSHAFSDNDNCNRGDNGWHRDYCQNVDVSKTKDRLLSSDPSLKLHAAHKILKAPMCYGISLSQLAESIVAKYADIESIPFLIKILKAKFGHRYDSGLDVNLRSMAALSIGTIINQHIGDKHEEDEVAPDRVVDDLIKTLSNSYDLRIRTASAQALGDVRDEKAIPVLQKIVDDPNENPVLQYVATQSLATLQSVVIEKNHAQKGQTMQANTTDPPISDPPGDISQAAQNYLLLNFAPAYMKLVPQN